MLLSKEQIKQLKQVSASKNPGKTKERLKADFSAASNATKQAIIDLSGQGRHSFYRAYDTGSANARIIIAMAQVLNITPFYYTGEQSKRDALKDEHIIKFLGNYGYKKLLAELGETEAPKARRKPGPKPKGESAGVQQPAAVKTSAAPIQAAPDLPNPDALKSMGMSKEEAVLLVEALFTQAKFSEGAKTKLTALQHLLARA